MQISYLTVRVRMVGQIALLRVKARILENLGPDVSRFKVVSPVKAYLIWFS